jgi:hypothetical protein
MLKTTFTLAVCAMLWVSIAAGQQAPATTQSYYCNASVEPKSDTYYFSASFTGPNFMDGNLVGKDFAQFVKEKYSLQGHVIGGCSHGDAKAVEVEIDKAKLVHHPFVATGWKPKVMPVMDPRHSH